MGGPTPSVQFSSVTQSYLTLCDPMDCSTPGVPVHHQLPEITQTHVHPVSEVIQLSREFVTSSVLSHCNKNLKRWADQRYSPWMDQCYNSVHSESKGKYILELWGYADPKDAKRREAPLAQFGSFFYMFFLLPLGLPYKRGGHSGTTRNWWENVCLSQQQRSTWVNL